MLKVSDENKSKYYIENYHHYSVISFALSFVIVHAHNQIFNQLNERRENRLYFFHSFH